MNEASFPRGGRPGRPSAATATSTDGDDVQTKTNTNTNTKAQTQTQNKEHNHPPPEKRLRPSELAKKRKSEASGETTNVTTDFLFGSKNTKHDSDGGIKKQKTDDPSSATSGSGTGSGKHSLLPLGGGGVVVPQVRKKSKQKGTTGTATTTTNTAPIIEALGFTKLNKGTKLLGCVREVHDEFAIVSLPNLLTGFLLLEEVQAKAPYVQSLTQCLTTGHVLAVVVQKAVTEALTGGVQKRRIQVSALPMHVNPRIDAADNNNSSSSSSSSNNNSAPSATTTMRGQIISVEDHGCLIDLGLGRQGFMKFDHVEGSYQLLEADEEAPTDLQVDPKTKALPRLLQPGRLFDFLTIPPKQQQHNNNNKTDGSTTSSSSVWSLKLPSTYSLAQRQVMPPASKHTTPYTLSNLQPGMLITTKVEALAKNGVCVTFLGNVFRGAMELGPALGGVASAVTLANNTLSSSPSGEEAWRSLFKQHQHFPARIIAIDVPTKLIRLSMAPSVLQLQASHNSTSAVSVYDQSIGNVVEDCRVVRVDPGIGALLALPTTSNQYASNDNPDKVLPKRWRNKSDLFQHDQYQQAMVIPTTYVHISKAYDDEAASSTSKRSKKNIHTKKADREATVGRFSKDFSMGSTHAVRILSTGHWMDGVASGGCAPRILQAHVLTIADLHAGQVYQQVPVCAQLQGGSILVNLGGTPGNPIRGLIPTLHLQDKAPSASSSSSEKFRRKVLEQKFAVDAKVDVCVLWVDHTKKQCIVTAKRSIIKAATVTAVAASSTADDVHDDGDGDGDKDDDANKEGIVDTSTTPPTTAAVPTSYEELVLGQTAVGFVSILEDRAMYVTFCNRVYGKVTAKSLASELGVERPKDNFTVGDVVTCRVVKITKKTSLSSKYDEEDDEHHRDDDDHIDMDVDDDTARPRGEEEASKTTTTPRAYYKVLLSLKVPNGTEAVLEDVEEEEEEDGNKNTTNNKAEIDASNPKRIHVQAGAILPLKSMKIIELVKGKRRIKGTGFLPGYAIVNIKSKYLITDESERSSMLSNMECKLPFDQLLDDYDPQDSASVEALDAMASRVLRLGKKINQKAIVLTDPHKSNVDHSSGVGRLTVVSLRKSLIETMEAQHEAGDDGLAADEVRLIHPQSDIFVGALVKGYIAQIDRRHGAFMRSLDGMTGLIPRMNGGLDLQPHSTIIAKVQVIDDTVRPFKIMLKPVTRGRHAVSGTHQEDLPYAEGDVISKARVAKIQLLQTTLELEDDKVNSKIQFLLHATMKAGPTTTIKRRKKPAKQDTITKGHPFYGMKIGDSLVDLRVVTVLRKRGTVLVHVTDHLALDEEQGDGIVGHRSELKAGMTVTAIVSAVHDNNKGLQVVVSPVVKGFIPGLELSTDVELLNNIVAHVPVGSRLECVVMDSSQWHENRAKCPFASLTQKSWSERKSTPEENRALFLSVLAVSEPTLGIEKPVRNDLAICRINKALPQSHSPSLMMALRGGFVGRCCITELAETDEWENMPLGRMSEADSNSNRKTKDDDISKMDVFDQEDDHDSDSESEDGGDDSPEVDGNFRDGKYVQCRVLKSIPKQSVVEVSVRDSRIEGDIEDDETPPEGETVQGFVVQTNRKGCFIRLARHIAGRVTLKELCDGFLHDPVASFPMGRLVVGKVKSVKPTQKKSKNAKDPTRFQVDLDMRETTLLEQQKKLPFEDVELQSKYKGTVTRVESYGVFVQLQNSNVSGLVHMSECSDNFIKNLQALYDPGDLVKILVIKKDTDGKKLGFSMKASHFKDDEESDDDDSSIENDEDKDMTDIQELVDEGDMDSDDENFASKLAAKMDIDNSDQDDKSESSDEDADDSEDEEEDKAASAAMDTNVGFDFEMGGSSANQSEQKEKDSSDDSDSDESDDEDGQRKGTSHKSRKKQAQRRREEREISKRELALADGTADENPETPGDFERLLAGNPNSSELWIRYMAFHLSVADISSARVVAEKALERIEFREEREKLNVWTALLTLEHKYGGEESLQKAVDRACSQNNPKKVYLRVCEILEKDLSMPGSISRADEMHTKMCKKFKSKKQVWLAHLEYLLKQSRHQEAHTLLKRALMSLAPYKHAEIMSRLAQLEFEYGSPERARTLFDGIVLKYSKRLDLFYVYLDKEVKFGSVKSARAMLEGKVNEAKLSDKQMKSLFKKWYRIEEQYGTEETMEHVKESARTYVQQTSQ